jgi:alkanesulfonate monooxygenase SsuD/methylene tetrahydromethanopterin reductase-like flavin-dependent oxidoreductase (luciferase family)
VRGLFIADTDAEAERLARPAYAKWFDNLMWLWRENNAFPTISLSRDYDESISDGSLVVGGPDTVRRTLVAQTERCGQNYLVLKLAFGSLTHIQEMRSLELFRREVMPALQEATPALPATAATVARAGRCRS